MIAKIGNLSWIMGYKSKKEDVSKDHDSILKNLTSLGLKETSQWNIDITTHKIRAKISAENLLVMDKQNDPRNIILKTLGSYTIVFSDNQTDESYVFYEGDENEKKKEFPMCTQILLKFIYFIYDRLQNKPKFCQFS